MSALGSYRRNESNKELGKPFFFFFFFGLCTCVLVPYPAELYPTRLFSHRTTRHCFDRKQTAWRMETLKHLANGIYGATNASPTPSGPAKVGLTSPLVDDHPAPLKIIIVGAGIGGLSAALGLRRNGHQVEVLYLFPSTHKTLVCAFPLTALPDLRAIPLCQRGRRSSPPRAQ